MCARSRGHTIHEAEVIDAPVTGTYDLVSFVDSFYYLMGDPGPVLQKINAILAPRGQLFLRLVNRNWLLRSAGLFFGNRPVPNALVGDAMTYWDQRTIRRCLEVHGFRVLEFEPDGARTKTEPDRLRRAWYQVGAAWYGLTASPALSPGLFVWAQRR